MSILSYLTLFLSETLNIYNFKDILEILLISIFINYFLKWLIADKQKNLVYWFYNYCLLVFITTYFQLQAINYLLLNFSPVILILFIVLHQEKLQKNFITLKRFKNQEESINWFEEFTRSILGLLNSKKEIIFLIERHDNLKELIKTSCIFYADFKKEIFEIVTQKHISSNDHLIWLNQEGKIVAINCVWNLNIDEQWITSQAQLVHKWKQDAIYISSKTDAIIFKVNNLSRTFDLIFQGKLLENISGQVFFEILERNLANLQNKTEFNYNIKRSNKLEIYK